MFQKSILQKILAVLARAAIRKYKPLVIGITGSVGKTSTRQAVFAALKKKYKTRTADKNYNNEIGFPLAILGIEHCGKNAFRWLLALIRSALGIYLRKREGFPKALVLEYGIDHPEDMDYLLSMAKPDIAIVTALGEIPVHVEFFKDPEELLNEKAKIVFAVGKEGTVILNYDDSMVYDMKNKSIAPVLTFGFEENAEIRGSNLRYLMAKDAGHGDMPEGISFKVEYKGGEVPFRINGGLGAPQAYAGLAAAAAGISLGMNLVAISQALLDYVPPTGRMRILTGVKNSIILDDTYNSAPEAMRAALDTLNELPGKRKIAVLGDMLEIGKYSEQAHRSIGDRAARFADLLITVGAAAKFIADEAETRGVESNSRILNPGQILSFDDSESAGKELRRLTREGDLILVKGSQSMRMEKVVKEIMAEPERAGELLVRQEEYWLRI